MIGRRKSREIANKSRAGLRGQPHVMTGVTNLVLPALLVPAFATALAAASEPVPPPDFGLFMKGRHVYERQCMVCHGKRGDGAGELSPTLQPRPRSFREGMFKFRSTPAGKLPTEEDLRRTIKGGLSGTAMGMFTQLSDADVDAVIAYLKSFSRRWRQRENYAAPVALPPPPPWFEVIEKRREHVPAGSRLFALHCASCHGEKADGKGPAAVALMDIWGLPVLPSDLRQPHLRCGDSAEALFRVLSTGLDGTPMASFDAVLTEEQRWDVIAFIFSLRQPFAAAK